MAPLYRLLKAFEAMTGVPVLLNTSFNVKGEPIVETPDDAMACFLATGIDYLVLHDMLIAKSPLHRVLAPLIRDPLGCGRAGPNRHAGVRGEAAPPRSPPAIRAVLLLSEHSGPENPNDLPDQAGNGRSSSVPTFPRCGNDRGRSM